MVRTHFFLLKILMINQIINPNTITSPNTAINPALAAIAVMDINTAIAIIILNRIVNKIIMITPFII